MIQILLQLDHKKLSAQICSLGIEFVSSIFFWILECAFINRWKRWGGYV